MHVFKLFPGLLTVTSLAVVAGACSDDVVAQQDASAVDAAAADTSVISDAAVTVDTGADAPAADTGGPKPDGGFPPGDGGPKPDGGFPPGDGGPKPDGGFPPGDGAPPPDGAP